MKLAIAGSGFKTSQWTGGFYTEQRKLPLPLTAVLCAHCLQGFPLSNNTGTVQLGLRRYRWMNHSPLPLLCRRVSQRFPLQRCPLGKEKKSHRLGVVSSKEARVRRKSGTGARTASPRASKQTNTKILVVATCTFSTLPLIEYLECLHLNKP